MAKKKITEIVEEMLEDFLRQEGYELYNAEFVKEGRDWFLRVYIDKTVTDEYVGTEDCEKVSRFLSEKLDEEDPIEQNYYLEVSSPGMDRPLLKRSHYERYIGREVEIRLYKGKDGTKNIQGVLKDITGDDITVEDHDGREWKLQLSEIAKAKLAVIF
ncbi:MAG: ribosome maturation factor RimP [Lentihominibacter sp.]|nr:ribosome maturation factor RimP [Clostridiales bacterium]MDY2679085.1 ribosome maturation factor RimP [Lentihominibacter sp.]